MFIIANSATPRYHRTRLDEEEIKEYFKLDGRTRIIFSESFRFCKGIRPTVDNIVFAQSLEKTRFRGGRKFQMSQCRYTAQKTIEFGRNRLPDILPRSIHMSQVSRV